MPQGVPAAAGQRRGGQHHPSGPSFQPSRKNHLSHPPPDQGFAASIAERLAQDDQETYGEAWQTLAQKAARVKQRRDAKRSPNKNKGKRRKA